MFSALRIATAGKRNVSKHIIWEAQVIFVLITWLRYQIDKFSSAAWVRIVANWTLPLYTVCKLVVRNQWILKQERFIIRRFSLSKFCYFHPTKHNFASTDSTPEAWHLARVDGTETELGWDTKVTNRIYTGYPCGDERIKVGYVGRSSLSSFSFMKRPCIQCKPRSENFVICFSKLLNPHL